MFSISKQQAFDRWDTLSENLRDELVSDINSNFIWQTCEAEHIADAKIYVVSKLVGAVLMGFLHPEDMAAEIRDAIGIDMRIATSIASAINQRVFAPIRGDIDQVYNPITPAAVAPKIFEEIHPAPAAPTTVSTPFSMSDITSVRPPIAITPVTPAPVSLTTAPSVTAPTPPRPETVKPATEKAIPINEFEKAGWSTASPASASATPKPIIFQTESISKPITNAPDFRIPSIAEDIMGGRKTSESLPIRSAVVEMGGVPTPKAPPTPQSAATPKVTVVRYGTAGASAPPAPEPMRTITEVTPETLRAVSMPQAPAQPSFTPLSQIPIPSPITPKPPAPPAPTPQPTSQPQKVIQKDYSETEK